MKRVFFTMPRMVAMAKTLPEAQPLRDVLTERASLIDVIQQCEDIGLIEEAQKEEEMLRQRMQETAAEVESVWLSGVVDAAWLTNDVYVDLIPGAGGRDAVDFVGCLERMYTTWAGLSQKRVSVVSEGLKRTTLRIQGDHVGLWMHGETGTHRLVRISPFDRARQRHTSFAAVNVVPALPEEGVLRELPANEVNIDSFRASGAGGQHVNTTDSAVRATHLPTGLTAVSQSERSQHRNKAAALSLLAARVGQLRREEQLAAQAQERSERSVVAFGGTDAIVRSITLHPTQRVKCARSTWSGSDAEALLKGETLDEWMKMSTRALYYSDEIMQSDEQG